MANTTNLLTNGGFVQTPYISVKIGNYEFGKYNPQNRGAAKYPNYIQSLEITKINGKVNQYTLTLIYPINETADPNYFEKVFSSVSSSRKIWFTYGDMSAPNYIYKNEEAMITKVKSQFQLESSNIQYTVSAVSSAALGTSGAYPFPARYEQPSKVIEEILKDSKYGLLDIFTGMRNMTLVNRYNLIPHTDQKVELQRQDNVSPLDYLQYLVNSMSSDPNKTSVEKSTLYILTYVDDISGILGGSYFQIKQVDSAISHPEAYQLDIGYPGNNYVFNFNVENDENYSIYYDYQKQLHPQNYVSRIDENGNYSDVYAPILSSGNANHQTNEVDKAWWSKITQYPIKASVSIKGLLRPAVLMSYIRLNIILFGQKHINSGLYIITKQVDKVDSSGYVTTLDMQKISGDD